MLTLFLFFIVLPRAVRDNIAKELDRRLDLNIDELLASPKLEIKLSPAELDRQCVELYESVVKGPGGDLLRVIGGGNEVALQHRYLRRKEKELRAAGNTTAPFFMDKSLDATDAGDRTASQWVRWTMRSNLPANGTLPYVPVRAFEEPQYTEKRAHWMPPKPKAEKKEAAPHEENNLRMSVCPPGPALRRSCDASPLRTSSWTGQAIPFPSRLITNARFQAARRSGKGLSLLI